MNDHGNTLRTNYTVGGGVVQNFVDPTNPAPARPDFAGVDFDPGINTLRVDATDDVNVFDAKPSATTAMVLNGNLPTVGHPIVGGGDYLRLDITGTKKRLLHITSPGSGFWSFKSPTLPLTFDSIERFNHVDAIGYNGDKGKPAASPFMTVRDAENGALKFTKMAYASSFRGGVRWAFADMNFDGLPDLVTVTGKGRTAKVKIFDGAPNALGKYKGALLTSFQVLPTGVMTGAFIAVGDVNHDGANDIVTSADAGWLPQVSVWDGLTALTSHTQLTTPFLAYASTFRGGVRVAVGDVDTTPGDSLSATPAEIITGTGKGAPPTVGIFSLDGDSIKLRRSFYAYPPTLKVPGIFVAVGDYNGDGVRDVIVSLGSGAAPSVSVFSGTTLFTSSSQTPSPRWKWVVQPASKRNGLRITTIAENGGNPFAVETVDLVYNFGPR